jgi:hypothetical protein
MASLSLAMSIHHFMFPQPSIGRAIPILSLLVGSTYGFSEERFLKKLLRDEERSARTSKCPTIQNSSWQTIGHVNISDCPEKAKLRMIFQTETEINRTRKWHALWFVRKRSLKARNPRTDQCRIWMKFPTHTAEFPSLILNSIK